MTEPAFTCKWLDHWFDDQVIDPKDLKKVKPMEHTTHGFKVSENKQMLVICQTAQEDGRYGECIYIVKKLITYRSDKTYAK